MTDKLGPTTTRLFNVDKRNCLDPSQGWERVATEVPIDQATHVMHDGLELPEATPHVYRSFNVHDTPGP